MEKVFVQTRGLGVQSAGDGQEEAGKVQLGYSKGIMSHPHGSGDERGRVPL